ncbi:MAG: NAD-binding protein [Candidatus Binataceae bacterium]|jgi:Trk K+ transport system NAD-binding subunit
MSSNAPQEDHPASFLVCGLGKVGQQCVLLLKEFEVSVIGIDRTPPLSWQTPELPDLLDGLVIGDCSRVEVLQRAGIARCRAALLVTDDERINIAAAFAARSLNPNVRLVIRSAQENLNQLLRQQMGNLVAFEPSQFSANIFALASLGDATQALFDVGGAKMRVVRLKIQSGDDWCEGRRLSDLNTASHRILCHAREPPPASGSFHSWNPEDTIQEGDVLTFIENADRAAGSAKFGFYRAKRYQTLPSIRPRFPTLGDRLKRLWRGGTQIRRVALASSMIMLALVVAGIALFRLENPNISWFDALNVSVVLALGGFDNVFGALRLPFPISSGLYLFSVVITISSAVFLGILYAMMTERVLSARLQIARRRPHAPLAGHTIIIGMGVIGRKVAAILRDWRQPIIGLAEQPVGADIPPDMPLQIGPLRETLELANVTTAKSVVVVTDDEVTNLEISLMIRSFNPHCTLVFRTADQQFAKNVASLIPASIGIGDYAIVAEAIAVASFGENILSAFHLDGRTLLATEYTVEAGDNLIGHLLAEIAYGYDVAPIVHQHGDTTHLLPADDIRLDANDRVVVLATIDSLQRIETAQRVPPSWFLRIEKTQSFDAAFDAANAIARISGCELRMAREAMAHLPARLDVALYRHQGLRLVRELKKMLVTSSLEPTSGVIPTSTT